MRTNSGTGSGIMPEYKNKDLEVLISDLLDGELAPEAKVELQSVIANDPEARLLYVQMCEMHAALTWENGLVIADLENHVVPTEETSPSNTSVKKSSWYTIFAIAASALIFFGLYQTYSKTDPMLTSPVIGKISSRIDAKLIVNSQVWEHVELREGSYEVLQGIVELKYDSGVTVLLEAPAKFVAHSTEKLILQAGRLSANVPPEGIGFTVETPEAEVIDFGTEFAVEVTDGESEVHVFEGHVKVQNKKTLEDSSNEIVDLHTSEAVRVSESTGKINLASDRFIRTIEEPQYTYPRLVESYNPIAYYRMPIRQQGLTCTNKAHVGEVLTGEGKRPAWAPGFIGASLRVSGRSIGRGAYISNGIEFPSGQFTIMGFVRADSRPEKASLVTNYISNSEVGSFRISLDDQDGTLQAEVITESGKKLFVKDTQPIELTNWIHFAVTLDGNSLRFYRDGVLIDEFESGEMIKSCDHSLWIGTKASGRKCWDGRIDELAFFDQALSTDEIQKLYQNAFPNE